MVLSASHTLELRMGTTEGHVTFYDKKMKASERLNIYKGTCVTTELRNARGKQTVLRRQTEQSPPGAASGFRDGNSRTAPL